MQAWLPGEEHLAQQGQDLGQRMQAAFADAFARGARRVALIGTDTPSLSRAHVRQALADLDEAPVVVGPARDGGYYLLALDSPQPALFRDVPWGSPAVLETTLARAEEEGLAVRRLEELTDVDSLDDVRAEWPALQALLQPLPELLARIERSLR